jgi:hypothetical protein
MEYPVLCLPVQFNIKGNSLPFLISKRTEDPSVSKTIDYETNKNSLFYLLKEVVFRIKCYLFKNESLTTLFNTIDKIKAEGYINYTVKLNYKVFGSLCLLKTIKSLPLSDLERSRDFLYSRTEFFPSMFHIY